MSGRLTNCKVVVTGSSSGIGEAIALTLAEAGASEMLVHYRQNRAGAEKTAAAAERHGCSSSIVAADLGVAEDRQRLCETAFERLGQIDIWVHNAGADVLTGAAAELAFDAKLRRLLEVDVMGTVELARAAGERMKERSATEPASMIFIGWDQAIAGMEGDAGQMFGPAKAAVMAFANSLAQTLAPQVRINTIAPGWIRTSWGETTSEYWDRRAKGQSLMRRWGHPRDVARAVLFAADPNNAFLTGQTIEVNGGWDRRFDR